MEIEGNTLTVEQITDFINNKRIIAPKKDLFEVQNAIKVYSQLDSFNANNLKSLSNAHKLLMTGLINNPGKFRTTSVGIVKRKDIAHMAPPGKMVFPLMKDLFDYLKYDKDLLLIKSCVFHYEFEFIHPFLDGNGRLGRLWQTVILMQYSKVFEFLPIESLIKDRQQEYYKLLRISDKKGNSTIFVEFMLQMIQFALSDLLKSQNFTLTEADRISLFKDIISDKEFSRQDYLRNNKDISSATASRDLKSAVDAGILIKTGDKRLTRYRFKKN